MSLSRRKKDYPVNVGCSQRNASRLVATPSDLEINLGVNVLLREQVSAADVWLRGQIKQLLRAGVEHVSIKSREQAIALFEKKEPSKARRRLWCSVQAGLTQFGPCGLRECSECAERRGKRLYERQAGFVAGRNMRHAVLQTYASETMFTLERDLDHFKRLQRRQRERRSFSSVCMAGTLTFEVPLTLDHRTYNCHAHGVLDLNVDGERLNDWMLGQAEDWRALTGRPGSVFDVEPVRSVDQLLRYGLKLGREDKSYETGNLPSWAAAHVEHALRRKRLVISWGTGKAERP